MIKQADRPGDSSRLHLWTVSDVEKCCTLCWTALVLLKEEIINFFTKPRQMNLKGPWWIKSAALSAFQSRCCNSVSVTESFWLWPVVRHIQLCSPPWVCARYESYVRLCTCLSLHLFLFARGIECVNACVCGALLTPRCARQVAALLSSEPPHCRQGRPLSTTHTQTHIYRRLPDDRKRTESKNGSLCALNHLLCACMYVCKFALVCVCVCVCVWVWVVEHMCVYHDASPQLSHSFPATSRGWKRVKPQTSGAPQPIRIVYLASHGRLAEQEHTASHTARLSPSLSLSFSTPLNSSGSIGPLPASRQPLPTFSKMLFYYPRVRCNLFQDVPEVLSWSSISRKWFGFV